MWVVMMCSDGRGPSAQEEHVEDYCSACTASYCQLRDGLNDDPWLSIDAALCEIEMLREVS